MYSSPGASQTGFLFNRITSLGQFNWVEKVLCKWDFHINKSSHGLSIWHLMYLFITLQHRTGKTPDSTLELDLRFAYNAQEYKTVILSKAQLLPLLG